MYLIRILLLVFLSTLFLFSYTTSEGKVISFSSSEESTLAPVSDSAVSVSYDSPELSYSSDSLQSVSYSSRSASIVIEPTPFTCTTDAYVFSSSAYNAQTDSHGFDLSTGTKTSTQSNINSGNINAIGYNVVDNFIWGYDRGNYKVVKVGSDYKVASYDIPGLPSFAPADDANKPTYHIGDVSVGGILHLATIYDSKTIYRVDLNPLSANYLTALPSINVSQDMYISDFAFSPIDNLLYAVDFDNNLIKINQNTGSLTNLGSLNLPSQGNVVSVFFDKDGNLYAHHSRYGDIHKIATPHLGGSINMTYFSTIGNSNHGDGARCSGAAVVQPIPACDSNDNNLAVDSLPIKKVVLETEGTTVTQTYSGQGGLNDSGSNEAVNIKSITINNNGTDILLNQFATTNIEIKNLNIPSDTYNQDTITAYQNGLFTRYIDSESDYISKVNEVLSTTDIRDYLTNNDESHYFRMFDMMYTNYTVDKDDYVLFQERYGNSPFSLLPLDINGDPIEGALRLKFNDSSSNRDSQWNTDYEGGTTGSEAQAQYFGIVKLSQFNVGDEKVYGFRYCTKGADSKFYVVGEESFESIPVAEYRFDECDWDGTAGEVKDSTSNNFHGTASAATTNDIAQINRSGLFNGTDAYITKDNIYDSLKTTSSLSFWIKTTQTGNNTMWSAPGILGVEEAGGGDDIFWGWIDGSGHIGLLKGNTAGAKSTTVINNDSWHHVVLTRNSTTGKCQVFINGNLENSNISETGDVGNMFNKIGVIEDTGGTPNYFNGQLDELKVFDTELEESEIQSIYDNEKAKKNWNGDIRSEVTCDAPCTGMLTIKEVVLETEGKTVIQTASRQGGLNDGAQSTPVYLKSVTLNVDGNDIFLDNSATQGFEVQNINIPDSAKSLYYTSINGIETDATNANFKNKVEEVLGTTDIRDYLRFETNDTPTSMDIIYKNYPIDANHYLLILERAGNSSFHLEPLDANGNVIVGSRILYFTDGDMIWDTGYIAGEDNNNHYYQNQNIGVIKASCFNVGAKKIYGFRLHNNNSADPKFFVLGEESFGEEPTMSIANETITEGDSGTQNLNFTVSLDKATTGSLTFDYQVFAGSNVDSTLNATTPSDYTSTGTVVPASFDINSQTYTISIPINGDTEIEEDETFTIVFSDVQGATLANDTATGTILNDDSSTEPKSCGLVATSIMPSGNRNDAGNGASVVAFDYSERGTINDTPALMELASAKEVGTVWGKAYNGSTKKLYASAFLRRHADLSPDGLGAIYEIDVNTKTPTLWMNLNSKTHLGSS
ncbi:MAG: Unknown protein, partial [uncultured Sulfurovum sp.]